MIRFSVGAFAGLSVDRVGAFVGAGSSLLLGIDVGENAVVGMGV